MSSECHGYKVIYINNEYITWKYPLPVTVTTRLLPFLVLFSSKIPKNQPSFVTVTGWGGRPNIVPSGYHLGKVDSLYM